MGICRLHSNQFTLWLNPCRAGIRIPQLRMVTSPANADIEVANIPLSYPEMIFVATWSPHRFSYGNGGFYSHGGTPIAG